MSDKKNILIVEDELPLQKAIASRLNKCNFNTYLARSVDEAIAHLSNEKIDAIWLDHYLLGEENGLDFVTRIKLEDSQWKNIPIVVVSNTASPDKVKSYMNLGVNSYFTKVDYSLEKIIEDLNKLLA
jgi:DNA-binding response OmpR family regulator